MKKNFFKENLAYILALVFNLTAIGFLFAPLLTYVRKVEGTKIYYDINIINFFDKHITRPWLAYVFIILISISLIALIFSFVFKNKKKVKDVFDTILLVNLGITFAFCFINKELFNFYAGEYGIIDSYHSASIDWGTAVILFLIGFEFLPAISLSSFSNQSVKAIAENGMLISAAFVLSFVKFPSGASGGSINFQMLPLMIIALRRGPLNGFICGGIIYGLLTCISDGYGFATYPFDYLIGFGSVAILGFFRKIILPKEDEEYSFLKAEIFLFVGALLATFLRFVGGTASSMVIYDYKLVPAMAYNAIYISVSGLLGYIVIAIMLSTLIHINHRFPVEPKVVEEQSAQ